MKSLRVNGLQLLFRAFLSSHTALLQKSKNEENLKIIKHKTCMKCDSISSSQVLVSPLFAFFSCEISQFFHRAQIITRPWINHHLLKTCSHFSHFRCLHFTTLLRFFRDRVISNWKFFMVLRISPPPPFYKNWLNRKRYNDNDDDIVPIKNKTNHAQLLLLFLCLAMHVVV